MIALIMAGGAGTRFWPASRAALPKQFLRVAGEKSMLQLTYERLRPLIPPGRIFVVTAGAQAALAREHLPEIPDANVIIEPFGMNTAPCIALGLACLQRRFPPRESMLVLPADHVIRDAEAFRASLVLAEEAAGTGALITFGIVPEYPATGYGYIEAGGELRPGLREVLRFKEKPDLATATDFLCQGNFFWNSGMFCWTLESIREAYSAYLPQALELAEEAARLLAEGAAAGEVGEIYRHMPRTPVDIGILEPASNRAVIPVDYGWSDVGSWKALADISPADADLNSFRAPGLAIEAHANYVYSDKFVALIGVDDLCVVETPEAILVSSKTRSEEVKKVVEHLIANKKDKLL